MNAAKLATIEATASDADTAARDVVENWPSDIIASHDLSDRMRDDDGKLPHAAPSAVVTVPSNGALCICGRVLSV